MSFIMDLQCRLEKLNEQIVTFGLFAHLTAVCVIVSQHIFVSFQNETPPAFACGSSFRDPFGSRTSLVGDNSKFSFPTATRLRLDATLWPLTSGTVKTPSEAPFCSLLLFAFEFHEFFILVLFSFFFQTKLQTSKGLVSNISWRCSVQPWMHGSMRACKKVIFCSHSLHLPLGWGVQPSGLLWCDSAW